MGKFISCIQCAAVVFLASFALAADEISSVQFEQPSAAYKFDENVLKYNISSKKGTLYSERTVSDDIKRLHGMGMFSDVSVKTEKDANGKIRIIFSVTPQNVVEDIRFNGNKAYDTKALTEKLSISPVCL